MQIGFVGLGKMGLNMVTRLVRGGHEVVVYDRSADAVRRGEAAGARGVATLDALVSALTPPRAVTLKNRLPVSQNGRNFGLAGPTRSRRFGCP